MWRGHFARYPHGDPFTHFMLAQICVILANALGVKKQPDGAPKQKPDPLALTITDYAPHLAGSAFEPPELDWTEADEIKLRANMMLGMLNTNKTGAVRNALPPGSKNA